MFVADDDEDSKPPLARLLSSGEHGGGGRGGQLRLKLYLSLLWVAAAAPYEVVRPARAWAGLLGLNDVEERGTRRVQATLRELAERDMIRLRERGGQPSGVTVLSDLGDGERYKPPAEMYNHLRTNEMPSWTLLRHRYFRLPSTLWTTGLIAHLNGPGLAMLLVLRCEQQGRDNTMVWFSPERAANRFGLSESTRRAGLEQLREFGLVTSATVKLSESGDFIDVIRRRKIHSLNLGQLEG
ncbi:hypothetical protein [Nocardia sp. XZ_19_385]|uniref:hypothetical protein n=1 Tax=Nocardia sp. XZ_19_385 TaxID=2769488 RepID=UPI00188F07B1|nr:hypothetical protein [Nocardia sp. XZ_19_385]